jgi:protein required for attachment to host cells
MNIPNHLPAIQRPTLMVVSDVSHATFFALRDRELESAGEITIDYPPKNDTERTSIQTPSGMHSAEQSENLEMEKIHRFSHQLADELRVRVKKDKFEEIYLTASQEHLQQFLDALHSDILALVTRTLPKQVSKESPIEVLLRLYEKTA